MTRIGCDPAPRNHPTANTTSTPSYLILDLDDYATKSTGLRLLRFGSLKGLLLLNFTFFLVSTLRYHSGKFREVWRLYPENSCAQMMAVIPPSCTWAINFIRCTREGVLKPPVLPEYLQASAHLSSTARVMFESVCVSNTQNNYSLLNIDLH